MARQAEPTPATSALRELRRTLRDERVALGHEGAVLELAGDDHLASLAKRVRHNPDVGDRHGLTAVAVADAEAQGIAPVLDGARHDLSGHLVRAPGLELARLAGLGGRAEARVDECGRKQDGGR